MAPHSDSASGENNKGKSSSQKVASAVASAKSAADAASAASNAVESTKSASAASNAAARAATSAATSAAQRAAESSATVSAVKDAADTASPVIQAVEHAVDSKNKSVSKLDSAQDSNEENSEVEVLQEDEQDEKNSISASGTTSAAPSSKKMKGYKVPGEKESKELYHIEDGLFNKMDKMSEDQLEDLNKYVDEIIKQGGTTATQYVKTNVYARDSNFGWKMAANAATLPKVVTQRTVNRASRKVSENLTKRIEERYYGNLIKLTVFKTSGDAVVGEIVNDFDSIRGLILDYQYDNITDPKARKLKSDVLHGRVKLIRSPEVSGKRTCEFTRYYEKTCEEGTYWDGEQGSRPTQPKYWPLRVIIEFKSANIVGSSKHIMTVEFSKIAYIKTTTDINAEFPGYTDFEIGGQAVIKD